MSIKRQLRTILVSNSEKSSLKRKIWNCLHIINITLFRVLPDDVYFKVAYKRNCGEYLDFSNPQTFDAKQLWLKMYYRNPLCVICSDKYLVRDYVQQMGFGYILNPIFGVYDSADEIDWDKLPNQFYLKANNMSGCNIRCNDKSTFDLKSAQSYLTKRLKRNYYYESREWNYRDIPPKIIAEAIIASDDKAGLIDYRFLCADGKCHYVFIDIDTADDSGSHKEDARRNVYDRDMNLLDVTVSRHRFDPSLIRKPDNWEEMLKCAEALSGKFPFCRVDLYNIKGKIFFGEITFFHSGGLSRITPDEWRFKLGEIISIDSAKIDMNNKYEW